MFSRKRDAVRTPDRRPRVRASVGPNGLFPGGIHCDVEHYHQGPAKGTA